MLHEEEEEEEGGDEEKVAERLRGRLHARRLPPEREGGHAS